MVQWKKGLKKIDQTVLKQKLASLAQYPAPARLAFFIFTLVGLWVPFAVPIYWLVSDRNWVSILTMVILYLEFIALTQFWGKNVYNEPQILQRYGLQTTLTNRQDAIAGAIFGGLSVVAMFALQGLLGWLDWQVPNHRFLLTLLAGLAIAMGVGFAEELVFRGWLLDELQRDYSEKIATAVNAIAFALLHFIKPPAEMLQTWPQFPGLLLLGLILVWAKYSTQGRLGLSIGLHAGFVGGYYIIRVGNLVQPTNQVPEWYTGINGNPLAGLIGLCFLSAIALLFWKRAQI